MIMTHFVMASQCVTVRHGLEHPGRFFTFLPGVLAGQNENFFGSFRSGVQVFELNYTFINYRSPLG